MGDTCRPLPRKGLYKEKKRLHKEGAKMDDIN